MNRYYRRMVNEPNLSVSSREAAELRGHFRREQVRNPSIFGAKSDNDIVVVKTLAALPESKRANAARAMGVYDERYTEGSQTALMAAREYQENRRGGDAIKIGSRAAAAVTFGAMAVGTGGLGLAVGALAAGATVVAGNKLAKPVYASAENQARMRMAAPSSFYHNMRGGNAVQNSVGTNSPFSQQYAQRSVAAKTQASSAPVRRARFAPNRTSSPGVH